MMERGSFSQVDVDENRKMTALLASMEPRVAFVWPLGALSSACGVVPLEIREGERSSRVTWSPSFS